jgi:LysR family glycine cleavage system transcriptional activator
MIATLPYASLRTFESVVRLRGFSRAAEELGVTQSAVSQHVRALEEWLGRRLIDRKGGRVAPTDDGLRLAAAVLDGFGKVNDVCLELRSRKGQNLTIGLSCPPGFAYNWLFPRLINFDQIHPQYAVSIITSTGPVSPADDEADIAIRYGLGGYPGLHIEPLLGERIFPVCAPSLLQRPPGLRDIADLARHTLLVDDIAVAGGSPPSWSYWAEEVGVTLPRPARTRRFGQSNMVVQAAINGLGIALGREPLVLEALYSGALVRPFPQVVMSQFSYWIVCSSSALRSDRLRAIRDWLVSEAAQQRPIPPQSYVGV